MHLNTLIYRNIDFDEPNRRNRIGFGGCAEVFKLQEKKTGKTYAIKIFLDSSQIQDFNDFIELSEIRIISEVQYPTLLGLHGVTNQDPYYIIMEYMPNKTVQDYINKAFKGQSDKNWDLTHKMIVILGISFGMEYLHSHNIIHRDLKPLNVLLDSNFYPRIGDFGFSKIASNFKRLSSNLGTPIFSAPEQIGSPNYDGKKADVYSFAMTIYSILYDQLPFEGEEYGFALYERIKNGYRPDLNKVISISIDNLISRCWDQYPNKRPNFEEISEELLTEVRERIKRKEIREEEMNYFVKEFCKRKESDIKESDIKESDIKKSDIKKSDINEQMKKFEDEYKQDENYKNDREKFSLLHYAAMKNSKDIGEILITNGADINAKDIIYKNMIL